MKKFDNPFNADFGQVPAVWAGREGLRSMIDRAVSKRKRVRRQYLLHGPPGTGKTALLHEWRIRAEKSGWTVVEVASDRTQLVRDIIVKCKLATASRGWFRRLKGLRAGFAGVHVSADIAAEAVTETLAEALHRVATRSRRGVLFLIDEAHSLDDTELRTFGKAFQVAQADCPNKRFGVVVAGLSGILENQDAGDSATFLARLRRREVGLLTDPEVEAGIIEALEESGRTIDEDALRLAIHACGGWPHALQSIGSVMVETAGNADNVTLAHVKDALPEAYQIVGDELLTIAWRSLPSVVKHLLGLFSSRAPRFFDPNEFREVAGLADDEFAVALEAAARSGLIVELAAARYTFPLPFARQWINGKLKLDDASGMSLAEDGRGEALATSQVEEQHIRHQCAERLDAQARNGHNGRSARNARSAEEAGEAA